MTDKEESKESFDNLEKTLEDARATIKSVDEHLTTSIDESKEIEKSITDKSNENTRVKSTKSTKADKEKLLASARDSLILPITKAESKEVVEEPTKSYKADRRMVKPKTVYPIYSSAPPNKPTRYTKYYKGK